LLAETGNTSNRDNYRKLTMGIRSPRSWKPSRPGSAQRDLALRGHARDPDPGMKELAGEESSAQHRLADLELELQKLLRKGSA
jgi:hypothetical protein